MKEFAQAVQAFLEAGTPEAQVSRLAEAFGVIPSAANRWARGTAWPHPLMQAQIMLWIEEHS